MRSWQASEGDAAILYDWERKRLEVVYERPPGEQAGDSLDLATSFSLEGEERRVGGEVDLRPGEILEVRAMLGRHARPAVASSILLIMLLNTNCTHAAGWTALRCVL